MTTQSSTNTPTGAANTILLGQGVGTASAFSTATYPATTTINRIHYSTANNVVGELATANRAVLTTTSAGVPVMTALATNGQVIIGSTAGAPAAATLTAGAGITVTNGSNTITIAATGGLGSAINSLVNGRITLTTGTPVTTANVTAATTVYFTPYKGNYITLYTAAAWTLYTFTEVSIAVLATTSTMYDLFMYDNAGVLTLEAVAWTNDTTRATAIVFQDGVYCKSGALDRRYLGSFRTTTVNGQTQDSAIVGRYIYNYYNRLPRELSVTDATASWTYTLATYRQARASAANQLDFIIGVSEDPVLATLTAIANNSTGGVFIASAIGLDSTTTATGGETSGGAPALARVGNNVTYNGFPGIGRHTLVWLEASAASGTTTWFGTNAFITSSFNGIITG